MAVSFTKNQVIVRAGQPLTNLYLILKGQVNAQFPGGSLLLDKGDVIGICETGFDCTCMTYTAITDLSVVAYPFLGLDTLEILFQEKSEIVGLFSVSAFRQVHTLLDSYDAAEYRCSGLYQSCAAAYSNYRSLCERNQIRVRPLPALGELEPFLAETFHEDWLTAYYKGLHHIFSQSSSLFSKELCAVIGLIGKTAADAGRIWDSFKSMHEYECTICQLYMNEELLDFFDMYTALYFKIGKASPDSAPLLEDIKKMIQYLEHTTCLEEDLVSVRISDFTNRLSSLHQDLSDSPTAAENETISLSGSMQLIMDYAEADSDIVSSFKKNLSEFKKMSDKNATDDDARKLRQHISHGYYALYRLIAEKSFTDNAVPIPVKMFLYFGFVDEELAGEDNSAYLYTLAKTMSPHSTGNVYTLYDWLTAIHNGKKEPSRNEFDQDYTEYLHHLKVTGKLTDIQEKQMLNDSAKRIEYELVNMFPIVNKITFGRISTFCPVFSEHNVLKSLSTCYVSTSAINDALHKILSLDYGAYCHESIYSNDKIGVVKEYIHAEYLPDFILMPGIGTRGVMWQEIEGKKRSTSSRMMLSIFELEDLYATIIRLTGEYRWEMCKRIQGPRWNDVSNRSLTSEYFDYIQFYKKNLDLSVEAKEKVKVSLQKAKNNYKEMFVRDYILWILFESSGSPRLNKVARTIYYDYCPFSSSIRDNLSNNPIYKELSEHHKLKVNQRLHHLENLTKKITNSGNTLPEELTQELAYTER